jgi:hypothetical protein
VIFKGAPFGTGVAPLAGVAGDRDLAPGQIGELGVQAGLVALDGDHVMRAALGDQVIRVGALGVQSVGGDHRAG